MKNLRAHLCQAPVCMADSVLRLRPLAMEAEAQRKSAELVQWKAEEAELRAEVDTLNEQLASEAKSKA